MKLVAAFFRLVRWQNICFIILTQMLFYFCVFVPTIYVEDIIYHPILFYLLVAASVLIAAAGYIINDYFDIQIDSINKPEKMVVNKFIKRRWAIVWHWVLSFFGIVISFYVSYKIGVWAIFLVNSFTVVLLWMYSILFKKKLLIGNLIIAALTAWVILVVYFFVGADVLLMKGFYLAQGNFNIRRLFKFTMLYAGFAFITTIIREAIKDIEDMEGDRKYDCKTMPIVWGVPVSKVFVAVWIVVTTAALLGLMLYAWQSGWWVTVLYILFLIVLPLYFLLQKMFKASSTKDYHQLSNIIKLIMLAGILSMILIPFFM